MNELKNTKQVDAIVAQRDAATKMINALQAQLLAAAERIKNKVYGGPLSPVDLHVMGKIYATADSLGAIKDELDHLPVHSLGNTLELKRMVNAVHDLNAALEGQIANIDVIARQIEAIGNVLTNVDGILQSFMKLAAR